MEEDIDLREYVDVVLRNWKWIVGLALIAAIVAGIASFLLPSVYEARALVVTEPRYLMRFDPRFETVNSVYEAYSAYPALATSDDLLGQVIAALGESLTAGERVLHVFARMVEANSGSDPSLIELKVKNRDAEKTALIANTWAGLYVKHLNDLYGQSSQEERFFKEQLAMADANLKAAEEALIEFQARNQANVLTAQLEAKETALADYLAARNSMEMIIQDAQGLREQLGFQEMDSPTSLADDLTSLLLEVDTLSREESLSIQLQVTDSRSLSDKTVGEQIEFLDNLMTTLQAKVKAIEEEIEALSPEILRLQEELQRVNTEVERLERARDVAQETYLTLSQKVEEVSIAAQSEMGDARLASRAAVPMKPVSPTKLLNTAVAGALGLMVGVVGAFVLEYFQNSREESIGAGQTGD